MVLCLRIYFKRKCTYRTVCGCACVICTSPEIRTIYVPIPVIWHWQREVTEPLFTSLLFCLCWLSMKVDLLCFIFLYHLLLLLVWRHCPSPHGGAKDLIGEIYTLQRFDVLKVVIALVSETEHFVQALPLVFNATFKVYSNEYHNFQSAYKRNSIWNKFRIQ